VTPERRAEIRPRVTAKILSSFVFVLLGAAATGNAWASYWFRVPDASQLQWMVDVNGKVWLRNLSSFDASVLGCCYNYHIDLNTAQGRGLWAALQLRMAQSQSVWISVPSQTTAGHIDFVANLD
jgi:hypothetical protein